MALILNGTDGVTFNDSSLQGAAASPYTLKNRIINGSMVVDQRNAGASVTPTTSGYTLDRWKATLSQASKYSVQQNAGSVTPPTGFTNYLGVTSLSSYSVGASDFFFLSQVIEGYNIADLAWGTANAQTITLSFWVRSSLTGTFGGVLTNAANDRTYPFTYTISSANTWTKISITVVGDTTGTWLTTNGIGMFVLFNLGAGATYSGTAGSWSANTYFSATGATSVVGTNGATFYITGVQLEIGTSATPFERRLYGQELANCQRYYWQLGGAFNNGSSSFYHYAIGYQLSTTQGLFINQYPVTMRSSPSFTVVNPTNFYVNTNIAVSAIVADQSAVQTFSYVTTNSAVGSAFSGTRLYGINATTNAIQFNAEL